ncbi:hypothetical protein AMTR_s00047p00166640 [Amborella trichopoda]|uniref:Cytochrome P450 n=1 Tax=Amborella trichopoda TaxID=13333 RepID=U5D8P8_AMBTC|nr:hypothetical protein AMTR_s00047p00166640 [Amborella trichopoda]
MIDDFGYLYMITGDNFLSWVAPKPQLFIREPELIREILNNKNGDYQKPEMNRITEKLLGDGLASTNNEKKWAFHRKMANKAFNAEGVKVNRERRDPGFLSLSSHALLLFLIFFLTF